MLPRTIAGRVLLAAVVTLAVAVGTLALLVPVVLGGYGAAPDPSSIGPRLVAAVAIAGVAGAVGAVVASLLIGRSVGGPVDELAARARRAGLTAHAWSVAGAPLEVERLADRLRRIAIDAARRQAEAESQRDRLATLLREMGDGVLIVRADDGIDLANPGAERLLVGPGATGRRLAEAARDHELVESVERARREGGATAEIERLEPRRSVRIVARLLPGGEVLVAAADLTAVRRLESVRRDFVANVSHELRTPLASLKAMAETLEGGALDHPADARDFVSRMHREIDELTQLVAELLALSRIESGAGDLRLDAVAPAELVGDAARRLGPLAERSGIHLEVRDAGGLPAVRADRDRIAQVLANLVHNAIKFTPAGGTVTLGATADDGAVRFRVTDTGAGIARDELERVFERFFKGEPSRATGGTGLGLAIAKHIVIAHGGAIAAESAGLGRGSTFTFTLPLR